MNYKKHLSSQQVRKFLVLFYFVGFVGFVIPFSHSLFVRLVPYALLLNIGLILYLQQPRLSWRDGLIFGIIYALGFGVEVVGVNTGAIFGSYEYGKGLGLKLWETPLLIGLNWLMLVYCSALLVQKWKIPAFLQPFAAAILMVAYDLILEQIASRLDMWHWQNQHIPLQNYLAWFGMAVILLFIFRLVRVKNPVSDRIFLLQTLFFIALFAYFKLLSL